jgi:hypothetical protein
MLVPPMMMPESKMLTGADGPKTAMPVSVAEIVPELLMVPAKVLKPTAKPM